MYTSTFCECIFSLLIHTHARASVCVLLIYTLVLGPLEEQSVSVLYY